MDADALRVIAGLFDAARTVHTIDPVLAPLIDDFVTYAAPRPVDRVLDLGTGTGPVARRLAFLVRQVVGLDVSRSMLRAAAQDAAACTFVRGDIHRLPFAAASFSLVTASFGLNLTDPNRSLRAIRRVVEPGGRLVLQEWGPAGVAYRAVEEALAAYAPSLADDLPPLWTDFLQDVEDYADWLAGFTVEQAAECAPVRVRLPSAGAFAAFMLAWPGRWEVAQMLDSRERTRFEADVLARLAALAEPDGSLIWEPVLFRVTARRG